VQNVKPVPRPGLPVSEMEDDLGPQMKWPAPIDLAWFLAKTRGCSPPFCLAYIGLYGMRPCAIPPVPNWRAQTYSNEFVDLSTSTSGVHGLFTSSTDLP
jgi:hypothetical protein